MPRKESYELQLKKSMKAAGIYDRKFDFQIRVCANKTYITTRYEDPDRQEGSADYIILPEGAARL